MEFIESEKVKELLASYPQAPAARLLEVRNLIVETAKQTDGVTKLLETTKWGEPSYVSKGGSTLRMDWKERTPDRYYLYFICSTRLVETFRLILGDELQFEGDRAIVLNLNEPIPEFVLQRCITLALTYHKVKHLPMLGV